MGYPFLDTPKFERSSWIKVDRFYRKAAGSWHRLCSKVLTKNFNRCDRYCDLATSRLIGWLDGKGRWSSWFDLEGWVWDIDQDDVSLAISGS